MDSHSTTEETTGFHVDCTSSLIQMSNPKVCIEKLKVELDERVYVGLICRHFRNWDVLLTAGFGYAGVPFREEHAKILSEAVQLMHDEWSTCIFFVYNCSGSLCRAVDRPAVLTRPVGRLGDHWLGVLQHAAGHVSASPPYIAVAIHPLRHSTAHHPDGQWCHSTSRPLG